MCFWTNQNVFVVGYVKLINCQLKAKLLKFELMKSLLETQLLVCII